MTHFNYTKGEVAYPFKQNRLD